MKLNQVKFFSIILLLLTIAMLSCNKNNEDDNYGLIPNVGVNFFIQPDAVFDYIPVGQWKYYDNEGYRGIVIYRIDQINFVAYERTCPYDPQESCARVEANPETFTLIDSCCMSSYNLIDGMPISGPSTLPLKQYFTEYDGIYLQIYNSN